MALYMVAELPQTIKECNHGRIEPTVKGTEPKRQAATAVQLMNSASMLAYSCGHGVRVFQDQLRGRADGKKFVAFDLVVELLGYDL